MLVRKPTHPSHPRLSSRLRGFTSAEIAMVATVIAILALLILPLFRERTEMARQAAVEDELASMAKAILLAEADTGIQPRLNDLDNGQSSSDTITDVTSNPPIAAWNGTLEVNVAKNRSVVVDSWLGPYAAYKRFSRLDETNTAYFIESNGPIYHVTGSNAYTGGVTDDGSDRYPVDPWGQPYLLFGKGFQDYDQSGAVDGAESVYNSSIIYSMGPNGTPGDDPAPFISIQNYYRETGILGTGDDSEYRF